MPHESRHADYLISDDPALLDADAIHAFLTRSYWAAGISKERVARSLQHSLCLGIYTAARTQIGLIRVITDYATFAYLCDVYVLESHRGHGLAAAAMQMLTTHERLQHLRRQHLVTLDAHGLYEKFGFKVVEHPGRHMEKRDLSAYQHHGR